MPIHLKRLCTHTIHTHKHGLAVQAAPALVSHLGSDSAMHQSLGQNPALRVCVRQAAHRFLASRPGREVLPAHCLDEESCKYPEVCRFCTCKVHNKRKARPICEGRRCSRCWHRPGPLATSNAARIGPPSLHCQLFGCGARCIKTTVVVCKDTNIICPPQCVASTKTQGSCEAKNARPSCDARGLLVGWQCFVGRGPRDMCTVLTSQTRFGRLGLVAICPRSVGAVVLKPWGWVVVEHLHQHYCRVAAIAICTCTHAANAHGPVGRKAMPAARCGMLALKCLIRWCFGPRCSFYCLSYHATTNFTPQVHSLL